MYCDVFYVVSIFEQPRKKKRKRKTNKEIKDKKCNLHEDS